MKLTTILLFMLAVSSAFLLPCPSPHTVAFRRACLKAKSSELALGDEPDILLRPGRRDDEANIRSTVAKMFMNPLSIDANNFVCAEDHGKLIGFGQVRPIGEGFELASLHVEESHRGRGIGSALVRHLLSDFAGKHGSEKLEQLFLLTLADTTRFYERLGFEVVPATEVPAVLKAEKAAGSLLQSFLGRSVVVCMRATTMPP